MKETILNVLNKVRATLTGNDPKPTATKPVITPVTVTPPAAAPKPPTPAFGSKYFKLEEFYYSKTAIARHINNTPTAEVKANLNWLCLKVLDPMRDKIGKPITISSGYRSPALNAVIGGVGNSQHSLGQAADFLVTGMSVKDAFDFIVKKTAIPFDQVIYEFGQWIHISYDHSRAVQRGQKLIAKKVNGATVYENAA
jgi:zinc D-Ala-D-Ala carboxypeptidase